MSISDDYRNPDFWQWVDNHIDDDPTRLRLRYHANTSVGFDIALAITQIECRQKYHVKFNQTLKEDPHFLFPNTLAAEQATSDLLASYHLTLLPGIGPIIDLTAGLGIDIRHLATKASSAVAVEIDPIKAENLSLNSDGRFITVCADCRQYLTSIPDNSVETLFIDPHRRDSQGGRVFSLDQCLPDVVTMLDTMSRKAGHLIVKASPMLDVTHTASLLPGVTDMIALGTNTECKELIAVVDLSRNTIDDYNVKAVTIDNDQHTNTYTYRRSDLQQITAEYTMPASDDILYIPSPQIMKVAPWQLLCRDYHVKKLHPNTQLFISSTLIDNFPGSAYHILRIVPYQSKYIKRLSREYPKIRVSTRNFGISPDALRKKLGVSDGGDLRLIGVTLCDNSQAMLIVAPIVN